MALFLCCTRMSFLTELGIQLTRHDPFLQGLVSLPTPGETHFARSSTPEPTGFPFVSFLQGLVPLPSSRVAQFVRGCAPGQLALARTLTPEQQAAPLAGEGRGEHNSQEHTFAHPGG